MMPTDTSLPPYVHKLLADCYFEADSRRDAETMMMGITRLVATFRLDPPPAKYLTPEQRAYFASGLRKPGSEALAGQAEEVQLIENINLLTDLKVVGRLKS